MAARAPPPDPCTHPHQKIFPRRKSEIYQSGPKLAVDFRYTNCFLASDPPPPEKVKYATKSWRGLRAWLSPGVHGAQCADFALVSRCCKSVRTAQSTHVRFFRRSIPIPFGKDQGIWQGHRCGSEVSLLLTCPKGPLHMSRKPFLEGGGWRIAGGGGASPTPHGE